MKVLVATEYHEIVVDDSDHDKCSIECEHFDRTIEDEGLFPYLCTYHTNLLQRNMTRCPDCLDTIFINQEWPIRTTKVRKDPHQKFPKNVKI